MQARLALKRLQAVALTHHHSDHISDLAGLAIARWVDGGHDPLTVVAPSGPCSRYAQQCLDAFDDQAFYGQAGAGAPPRPLLAVSAFDATGRPRPGLVPGGWLA